MRTLRELRTCLGSNTGGPIMKRLLMTAALCLFGTPALAQDKDITPIIFSIIDGETLLLRNVSSTTTGCDPLFTEFEAIDTLEGSPELTLKAEPGMVSVSSTKGR